VIRAVLIDFWATWCVPCRATLPRLDTLWSRSRDQGLVVLGRSADDDGLQRVRRFAGRLGLRYPTAVANDNMLDLYGSIRMIPTTVFIDRRGDVARRVVGSIDEETIDACVREVLGP
jgi:thiol-disulfide isomerase/thioredoxin